MRKKDCVLVVFDKNLLEETVNNLNFDSVNLATIVIDERFKNDLGEDEYFFYLGEEKISVDLFESIDNLSEKYKNFTWLLSGYREKYDARMLKNFLMTLGLEEANIINFEIPSPTSSTWLANYSHVANNGADFFATGDEYFRDALNLKFIPCARKDKNSALGGVNLADYNQNLKQSYSIAKNVFSSVKPGTIKFVIIGLSPNYFYRDTEEIFFKGQQLDFSKIDENAQADLNFDEIKRKYFHSFSAKSVAVWKDDLPNISLDFEEKNTQILKDYIKLCLDNGAKPVGVIFPFAPLVRQNYDKKFLNAFREIIHQLEADDDFFCVDMFELKLDYRCFCDMVHLNSKGAMFVNSILSLKLYLKDLIPAESFYEMSYRYLNRLAWVADKDEYNAFAEKIFKSSAREISRKDKIKIGFVLRGSAEWCGDDLYNLFLKDKRFEVTVFSFLELSKSLDRLFVEDFWHGIEQFKQRGFNVVPLDKIDASATEQDILIFLSPYFDMMPLSFQPENLTLKTLIVHIPYGVSMAIHNKKRCSLTMFNVSWKVFFTSQTDLDVYKKNNITGVPRGIYCGYPRMDVFFENDVQFHFDWKMTRPDSKKIIYAPHWSVMLVRDTPHMFSTFRWNHGFMYEFAKNHPEISFVYKPHPLLTSSAVREKVFPSDEAYEEYIKKWNDLPNAQVYTGAYYQSIFATSDGMILDSISFIAEYQFLDKPMIFLTREEEQFNELAWKILNASYLVNGKDLNGIDEMMKRVFIEGDDYKASERREVFDKYLNYFKSNKMLASESIYKNICEDLGVDKK